MEFNTFKEARKEARKLAAETGYYAYLGKINNGKYGISKSPFPEAKFYVHEDGRICGISDIKREDMIWNRHPEIKRRAYPFNRVRNRKPGENKREYLRDMAINGRYRS